MLQHLESPFTIKNCSHQKSNVIRSDQSTNCTARYSGVEVFKVQFVME